MLTGTSGLHPSDVNSSSPVKATRSVFMCAFIQFRLTLCHVTGWYTEGKDEQPRLFIATSDDRGATFSTAAALHSAVTSLPDNLQMAVHPDGQVMAVWEEVTGVRKRVVMRVSTDRGQTFGPMQTLSGGAKAEHPTVAIHDNGRVAIGWTEHAFPHNKIIVQQGQLQRATQ